MMQKGLTICLILIFGSFFLLALGGLTNFLVLQHQASIKEANQALVFQTAEAAINYYIWRLYHSPEDWENQTFLQDEYTDPQGGILAEFQLEITPPDECSKAVSIKATAWNPSAPQFKKTILVEYGQPSLAQFSFLTNTDVWFGPQEELSGPFHSNGGIRMDGEQNALATSAKETYQCRPIHGCQYPYEIKPGIWGEGEGGDQGLWQFPVAAIDFEGLTLDLAQMKEAAQESGLYLPPSSAFGWHLQFNLDTVNVYKVTKLKSPVWGYNGEEWVYESNSIKKQTLWDTFNLIPECSPSNLIFAEDKTWVSGQINTRTTVVAARFPDTPGTNVSIIISDSLTYPEPKKTKIALIAQKDVLVPLYSPDHLEIDAVLLAQKGRVIRYYYPSFYSPWYIRDKIELRGTIITNNVWTWTWVDSQERVISGYKKTETSYDTALIYASPPFFPVLSEKRIISWEEE